MSQPKYAIGVDFGTESGWAVLVEVSSGKEVTTAVYRYLHGVIDALLPGTTICLAPDWALQDPGDYLRTFKRTIPAVLKQTGVDPADVIGVGVDFMACTMLPVTATGTPLCTLPDYRHNPYAWVKLWKHHAAQPEADKINATARRLGEKWLERYGGKISSEWFFSKTLQILDEAPEIYAAADGLIEAVDVVVWQLTGVETRNARSAGYKAMWSKREGFPRDEYFAALDPGLAHVTMRRCRAGLYRLRASWLPHSEGRPVDRAEPGHAHGRCQCGCARLGAGGHGHRAGTHGGRDGHQHLSHAARQH